MQACADHAVKYNSCFPTNSVFHVKEFSQNVYQIIQALHWNIFLDFKVLIV